MKKTIWKWTIRLSVTALVCFSLLFVIVLNPSIMYANKTVYRNYSIYHQQQLNPLWLPKIDQATAQLKHSELYDSTFSLSLCLNDGSKYPALIEIIQGKAFGRGFHNKIVLYGTPDFDNNYVALNGRKWNLSQLLVHEAIHCLQFNKYGWWDSKPFANIPNWKWEGYPEYIARNNPDQQSLSGSIHRLSEAEQNNNTGWINFEDGTGASLTYFKNWLLVTYCMDIKKMSFDQLLKDTSDYQQRWDEMMNWYRVTQRGEKKENTNRGEQ